MKNGTAVELKRRGGWQLATVRERPDGNIDIVNADDHALVTNATPEFISMLMKRLMLRMSATGTGKQALYEALFS